MKGVFALVFAMCIAGAWCIGVGAKIIALCDLGVFSPINYIDGYIITLSGALLLVLGLFSIAFTVMGRWD